MSPSIITSGRSLFDIPPIQIGHFVGSICRCVWYGFCISFMCVSSLCDDDDFKEVENGERELVPGGNLMDMIAAVLILRDENPSSPVLRRVKLLCRSKVHSIPKEFLEIAIESMRPAYRNNCSMEDLADLIRVFVCNRFHDLEQSLVHFKLSMVNHSCSPNATNITWEELDGKPRRIVAERPIQKGEEILIDYLGAIESYVPANILQDKLSHWGFDISESLNGPDLSRCFICPSCKGHGLCPPSPTLKTLQLKTLPLFADPEEEEQPAEEEEGILPFTKLVCVDCGHEADDEYLQLCKRAELECEFCPTEDGLDEESFAPVIFFEIMFYALVSLLFLIV